MVRLHISEQELGHSGGTKRPTSCTLVLEKSPKGEEMDSETKEVYQEVRSAMEGILKSAFTWVGFLINKEGL